MYRRLWPLIAACFYYTGLIPLVRWWTRRSGPRLIILCYHNANANLRRHFRYLQRHYRILPLEVALGELYAPRKDGMRPADRRTPLALTFDDGYYDNYTEAFALARELHVPFTIFLIPGYIETGNRFWWLEGDYLAARSQDPVVALEGRAFRLDAPKERHTLARAINARVRHASSVAEREAFLVTAREALGMPASQPSRAMPYDEPTRPLGWPDVREMEASGWVTYGAHTMHHPILACLSDPAEVRREVAECRAVIEQRVGHAIRVFAYPVGKFEDIGDRGVQAVQDAGYRWAATTIPGLNTPHTPPALLRRIVTDTDEHWLVLAAQAAGVWSFLAPSRLLRVARHIGRRLRAGRSGK